MNYNVQFNEPGFEYQNYQPYNTDGDSFLYRLVYKTGLAKDKKSADQILIIIAIVAFVITGYFVFGRSSASLVPVDDPVEPATVEEAY